MVTISAGSGRLLRVGRCSDIEVKDYVPGPNLSRCSCGHDDVHFSPFSCILRSGHAGLRLGKLVQRLRAGLPVVVELQLAHKRVHWSPAAGKTVEELIAAVCRDR